jgi:hypothetical protein
MPCVETGGGTHELTSMVTNRKSETANSLLPSSPTLCKT